MTNCCSNSLCILLSNGISLPVLQVCVFFSAPAYVFGRIFFFIRVCVREPKLLLLLFPKKMGFCQSKKSPATNTLFRTREIRFYVDLTWLLNNTLADSFCLSLFYSTPLLRLLALNRWGWAIYNQINLQTKKGTQKTADTRWNIWQSYATKHRSIHVHCTRVCVCLLRTFILTDRVKSKEDFNLSVYRCCYRNQSLCQIHTHNTHKREKVAEEKKQSNRKLSVSKKKRKQNHMSLALVYRVHFLRHKGEKQQKISV